VHSFHQGTQRDVESFTAGIPPQSDEASCSSDVVMRHSVAIKSKQSRENTFRISRDPFYSSSDDDEIGSDFEYSSNEDSDYDWDEIPAAVDDGKSLRDGLTKWALDFNVTHTAVDALLSLLRATKIRNHTHRYSSLCI